MFGEMGFHLLGLMTHLKILPHTSQMRLFWPKEAYFCRHRSLLSCKCLLFHFLSSSCQKSQMCKGSLNKCEVNKKLQTEFETSNPLGKTLAAYLVLQSFYRYLALLLTRICIADHYYVERS